MLPHEGWGTRPGSHKKEKRSDQWKSRTVHYICPWQFLKSGKAQTGGKTKQNKNKKLAIATLWKRAQKNISHNNRSKELTLALLSVDDAAICLFRWQREIQANWITKPFIYPLWWVHKCKEIYVSRCWIRKWMMPVPNPDRTCPWLERQPISMISRKKEVKSQETLMWSWSLQILQRFYIRDLCARSIP